jgi:hypothetical protein
MINSRFSVLVSDKKSSKSKEKTLLYMLQQKLKSMYISHDYTANEGPVRIQNKWLVPIYLLQ